MRAPLFKFKQKERKKKKKQTTNNKQQKQPVPRADKNPGGLSNIPPYT
jgi:hypothetical protein